MRLVSWTILDSFSITRILFFCCCRRRQYRLHSDYDSYFLCSLLFLECDADLACNSDKIPAHAKEIPDHPTADRECPLRKIDNNTEKIFRVVVTVLRTSGSKLAIV